MKNHKTHNTNKIHLQPIDFDRLQDEPENKNPNLPNRKSSMELLDQPQKFSKIELEITKRKPYASMKIPKKTETTGDYYKKSSLFTPVEDQLVRKVYKIKGKGKFLNDQSTTPSVGPKVKTSSLVLNAQNIKKNSNR
jgi:hypothetical protein